MSWLYDSHIHLSDPYYQKTIEHTINGMKNMKIKACCVSMCYENSIETLQLAKKSDLIFPFLGIHPELSKDNLEKTINLIESNKKNVSGIGEIGLDPTYISSKSDETQQTEVFEKLLTIAEKLKKPVSIHSRNSLEKIFDIMSSYNTSNSLLHWFDGNKKQLKKAMDMGFFVSFGPVTVYANDKQSLLSYTHIDKILIETDGPVSFSRCFEMKSAQVGFLPSVAFCISKVLKKSFYDTIALLEHNTKSYLGI